MNAGSPGCSRGCSITGGHKRFNDVSDEMKSTRDEKVTTDTRDTPLEKKNFIMTSTAADEV